MAFPWSLVSTLGGGLLSGIFGSSNSSKNRQSQSETNQTNLRIARENNQTSMDLMREANQFNAQQADLAWDRQQQMFNMENVYNSPLEVVKRLNEANINPQVAFNGAASSYASAASGATPSGGASSVGIPNLTSPHLEPVQYGLNPFESIIQGVVSAASAQKMISDAKRSGVDTALLEETFDDAVQQMQQETKRIRLDNLGKSFEYNMLVKYGDKVNKEKLSALVEDVKNKILQGNNITADTYLKNQQGSLTQLEGQEKEAYVKRVQDFINNALNLGKEQIKTERSKQSLNYEQSQTERERRNLMSSEEDVNKANKVYIGELTKMSTAERKELIANSLALYEDQTGVHIDEKEKARVVKLSLEHMEKVIRQQGADYWNPFKYVGHLLGGSGTYNFTPQTSTRSVVRGFAK